MSFVLRLFEYLFPVNMIISLVYKALFSILLLTIISYHYSSNLFLLSQMSLVQSTNLTCNLLPIHMLLTFNLSRTLWYTRFLQLKKQKE